MEIPIENGSLRSFDTTVKIVSDASRALVGNNVTVAIKSDDIRTEFGWKATASHKDVLCKRIQDIY